MRRIALWFMSTVSVVVLLFGYHTSTQGPSALGAPSSYVSPSSSGTTTSGSGGGHGKATSGSGSKSSSQGSSSSSGSKQPTSSTVTGRVVQTAWGPVQVRLTVSSGTITKVEVLQYPNGNGTDAQINSYALPILVKETTDQQSAHIDMVSGATYTSTGYIQSLQSAIDQAQL